MRILREMPSTHKECPSCGCPYTATSPREPVHENRSTPARRLDLAIRSRWGWRFCGSQKRSRLRRGTLLSLAQVRQMLL